MVPCDWPKGQQSRRTLKNLEVLYIGIFGVDVKLDF